MSSSNARSLNRSSLHLQIAERLSTDIKAGIFNAGDLLPSAGDLAKDFGVSKPVIRECLTYLAAQGYVHIVNGKGTVVQEINEQPLTTFFDRGLRLNSDALMDLLDVRRILESKSVSLAAVKRTESDVKALRSIIEEMKRNKDDIEKLSKLDIRFHGEIAKCSGNSFLSYLIQSIRDSLVAFNSELIMNVLRDQVTSMLNIHEQTLLAIEKGDVAAAEKEVENHFDQVVTSIKDSLKQQV